MMRHNLWSSLYLFTTALPLSIFLGCSETEKTADTAEDTGFQQDTSVEEEHDEESDDTAHSDTESEEPDPEECEPVNYDPNPFITEVVEVNFGEGAGFGQNQFPDIIFGPPLGGGENSGSLDVLTLGSDGFITVAFDQLIVDGQGADLIVFENVFIGWYETGIVSASMDGETWYTWECNATDLDNNYPGCAGASPTLSHPDNCIDARDPELAGGDAFDLADIGLVEAKYIRVSDSGVNSDGGFDLDAIAIIHGTPQ